MKKTILLSIIAVFAVCTQMQAKHYLIRVSTNTSDWSTYPTDANHVVVDYTAGADFAAVINGYVASDSVWVAKGNYTIATTILPKASMIIRGGFLGNETTIVRPTSDLDANGMTEPWEFTNATEITSSSTWTVRVLAFTTVTSAIVDGITIRNIAFSSSSNTISGGMTGGINNAAQLILISGDAQSCELKNSIIKDCSLTTTSPSTLTIRGTICAYTGKITSCLIQGNSIQTGTASVNTFGGGLALYGGGTEGPTSNSPQAIGCMIRANKSIGASASNSRAGGVIINTANALGLPKLINCLVYNNETTGQGGGVYLGCSAGVLSNPEILNCSIIKNKASSLGGGILFNVAGKCNNSIIWGNTHNFGTPNTSSDICFNTAYNSTTPNFNIDNLAYGTKGGNSGVTPLPTLTNQKILTSGKNAKNTTDSTLTIFAPKFNSSTSAVGAPTDATTTTAMSTANFKLGFASPCLDYANNTLLTNLSITTDLIGAPRFANTTADLGAYELPYYNTTITFNSGGTVSALSSGTITSNPEGKNDLAYIITPNQGMGIQSILYNGTEVKTQLTNLLGTGVYYGGTYTAPALTANSTLVVTFEIDPTTSITKVQNDFGYITRNQSIEFRGLTMGEDISVFGITGNLILSQKVTNSIVSVSLQKGVYLVRVANTTYKVIVD